MKQNLPLLTARRFLLLTLHCLLFTALWASCKGPTLVKSGSEVTMDIPLAPEQAALLAGISRVDEMSRIDELAVDIYVNDQLAAEGVRGGIRAGVRGGIRAAESSGVRGAFPRRGELARPSPDESRSTSHVKRQDAGGSPPDLAFEITFKLEKKSARDGSNDIRARLRPDKRPDLALIELKTQIEIKLDETSGITRFEVQDKDVALNEVELPDLDGDGQATLVEVATIGLQAAVDSSKMADAATLQEKLATLTQKLQEEFKKQGIEAEITLITTAGGSPGPGDGGTTLPPAASLFAPTDTAMSCSPSPPAGEGKGGGCAPSAESFTFTLTCNKSSCTYRCSIDAAEFKPCSTPLTLSLSKGDATEGPHTLAVKAVDALGTADDTPATIPFTLSRQDSTPPDTTLTASVGAGLPALTTGALLNSGSITFTLTSTEAGSTFECSLDGAAYASCTTPLVLSVSKDGAYSFKPRAKDAAGNLDSTPAEFTWTVDATAPETTATCPASRINLSSISVAFSSPDTGATFLCQLDTGVPGTCTTPYAASGLSEAAHTLEIKAKDAAGNVDATPVTCSFTVDLTAPDTSIGTKPGSPTNSTSASFTFTSLDSTATFQCQFDQPTAGGSYATCTSPLSLTLSKGDGSYTLAVRAVDPAGNADSTPASHAWTLDTAAPDTSITVSPSDPTTSTGASFSFTSPDTGATFECELDGAGFASCTSPKAYSSLTVASHTFKVQARDTASNADASPASFTWTIDTSAPTFAGLASAVAVSTSQINLSWAAATDNVTAQSAIVYEICQTTTSGNCSTFTATYTTSAGATSYSVGSLTNNTTYYFVVRAKDSLGNRDSNTTEKSALTNPTNVVQAIRAGEQRTCALLADGTVKCWGNNAHGALGNGTTVDSASPVVVTGLAGAVAIMNGEGGATSASNHSCALLSDGSARCWGNNDARQLGDGTTADRSSPVAVSSLTNAIALAGGQNHTCALMVDGVVKCWGGNTNGQIGDGSSVAKSVPTVVSSLTGATMLTGAGGHNCALVSDGSLKCWGQNNYGQLGDGSLTARTTPVVVSSLTNVLAAEAGETLTCALVSGGTAKCWGSNGYGRLGDGTEVDKPTPVAVTSLSGAVALSAGSGHACSLISDGSVKCWGTNNYGLVGDGTTTLSKPIPTSVSSLTDAIAVTAGGNYVCALRANGTAKCWGGNYYSGQLGTGSTSGPDDCAGYACSKTPTSVVGLTGSMGVKRPNLHESTASGAPARPFRRGLSVGGSHVCALISDGTAKCWGRNDGGAIGVGSVGGTKPTPTLVSTLTAATALASGGNHNCALITDGTIKCWGYNVEGPVGDGSGVDKYTPVLVSSLTGAVNVIAGTNHESCALLADGSAKCWGRNNKGSVGDGTTAQRNAPVSVTSLTGAIAISHGAQHACALLNNGTVKCWGFNVDGQLGDGSTVDRLSPTTVSSLSNVVAVAMGGDSLGSHSCALVADGTVRCWGYNADGELGDNTTVNKSTPLSVSSLSTVVAVAAGYYHTCALLTDGTARCWGKNGSGQLGEGSTVSRLTPVAVSSLSGATAIGAGGFHSCALLSAGTVKCWGDNTYSDLGDGTTVNRLTPVSVTNLP